MTASQGELYAAFDEPPFPQAHFFDRLAEVYHFPAVPLVLDIGCGTGRNLLTFAQKDWRVIGLEPDPDFLETARTKTRQCPNVEVKQGGFDDIHEFDCYDLVTIINDPLAYILESHERASALQGIFRALKPSGVIFLEMTNLLFKLRHYKPITEKIRYIDGKRVMHIMQHEIDFYRGLWIHHDEYLIEGEKRLIRKKHQVAIISPNEIHDHLQDAGFINIRTYQSYENMDASRFTGRKMLFSAQKPL